MNKMQQKSSNNPEHNSQKQMSTGPQKHIMFTEVISLKSWSKTQGENLRDTGEWPGDQMTVNMADSNISYDRRAVLEKNLQEFCSKQW